MKNPFVFVATCSIMAGLAFVMLRAHATDIPVAAMNNTQNETLISTSATTTTNVVGTAFNIEGNHYHTFVATNTGTSQGWVIDRNIDSATWVVVSTNVIAAGAVAEVQMTGKWLQTRIRQLGTNNALIVHYLGGN